MKTEIYGIIHAVTGKAVLFYDGDREVWLPKSQIESVAEDTEDFEPGLQIEIAIPEWLAIEKGYV